MHSLMHAFSAFLDRTTPVFEFIAKKRRFSFLFIIFTMIYLCLFLGLLMSDETLINEFTKKELAAIGLALSILGGLAASLGWTFITWDLRRRIRVHRDSKK